MPSDAAPDDAETGFPGLRTWSGVYWLVIGVFIVWVALLTTLTMIFS
jgi:hypothetical protein